MTRKPTGEQPEKQQPGASLDEWCWSLQVLDDLAVFVRRHGPNSTSPLPVLNWALGNGRTARAELLSNPGDDPVPTLKAFAKILGTDVTMRHLPDRLVYCVQGRVGKKDGAGMLPRTRLAIRAVVLHPIDEDGDER